MKTLFKLHTTATILITAILGTHTALSATWVTWDISVGGNGHSYLAVPGFDGLTWNMADQLAQAQGGYLATINSSAENDFVFSLVNSSATTAPVQHWVAITRARPRAQIGPGSPANPGLLTTGVQACRTTLTLDPVPRTDSITSAASEAPPPRPGTTCTTTTPTSEVTSLRLCRSRTQLRCLQRPSQ